MTEPRGPNDEQSVSVFAVRPELSGFHHVKVPVTDVLRSRDWYSELFGFACILTEEEEDRVVGVVLEHPVGLTLGLHNAPALARELRGFDMLAFSVRGAAQLRAWEAYLCEIGADHSPIRSGHLGWVIDVPDPDGIVVRLRTREQPGADEA